MNCSFAGTTVCKLITNPANLLKQFQQKQLIVFSFPETLRGVFVFVFVLLWTGERSCVGCLLLAEAVGGGRVHDASCKGKKVKRPDC